MEVVGDAEYDVVSVRWPDTVAVALSDAVADISDVCELVLSDDGVSVSDLDVVPVSSIDAVRDQLGLSFVCDGDADAVSDLSLVGCCVSLIVRVPEPFIWLSDKLGEDDVERKIDGDGVCDVDAVGSKEFDSVGLVVPVGDTVWCWVIVSLIERVRPMPESVTDCDTVKSTEFVSE